LAASSIAPNVTMSRAADLLCRCPTSPPLGELVMAWKILSPISVQIKSLADARPATAEAHQR
jgi:hypothetical protein